jgi:hypothetical protein
MQLSLPVGRRLLVNLGAIGPDESAAQPRLRSPMLQWQMPNELRQGNEAGRGERVFLPVLLGLPVALARQPRGSSSIWPDGSSRAHALVRGECARKTPTVDPLPDALQPRRSPPGAASRSR